MSNKSVKIWQLKIPLKRIAAFTSHQRYAYYMLGHIFNEMMTLQKIVGFAIPKHDDVRPARRNAEVAQLFFLFRLTASKIYEVRKIINSSEFANGLNELVFTEEPHLRQDLKALNRAISGAVWLGRMRNGMGFHYPGFREWEVHTTPDSNWVDDSIYFGEESGNVFYDASASVAMHWMFDEYRDVSPPEAVGQLADELIQLIKEVNRFTENALKPIIMKLTAGCEVESQGTLLAPKHDKVGLPYWTFLAEAKRRKEAKL